jgi:hypothetical protein
VNFLYYGAIGDQQLFTRESLASTTPSEGRFAWWQYQWRLWSLAPGVITLLQIEDPRVALHSSWAERDLLHLIREYRCVLLVVDKLQTREGERLRSYHLACRTETQ